MVKVVLYKIENKVYNLNYHGYHFHSCDIPNHYMKNRPSLVSKKTFYVVSGFHKKKLFRVLEKAMHCHHCKNSLEYKAVQALVKAF